MRFQPIIIATAVAIGLGNSPGATSNSTSPSGVSTNGSSNAKDFNSFRVIADKNIFNQSRYARSSTRSDTREVRRTVPSETFQLTGVLSSEKGDRAFFESSRSEYQKVARIGDKLGSFSVASIRPNAVVLVATSNKFELPVGKQMRRHEDAWEIGDRPESNYSPPPVVAQAPPQQAPTTTNSSQQSNFEGGPPPLIFGEGMPVPPVEGGFPPPPDGQAPPTTTQPTTQAPSSVSAPAGSADEVLRRLMQRREQEMNR
jgi:hypothetical protein